MAKDENKSEDKPMKIVGTNGQELKKEEAPIPEKKSNLGKLAGKDLSRIDKPQDDDVVLPVYDHFLIRIDQTDVDIRKEQVQINKEKKKTKAGIYVPEEVELSKEDEAFDIDAQPDSFVETVYSVGPMCERVKPGDKVILRPNAAPAVFIRNGYFYQAYAERAIIAIVRTPEQHEKAKISENKNEAVASS